MPDVTMASFDFRLTDIFSGVSSGQARFPDSSFLYRYLQSNLQQNVSTTDHRYMMAVNISSNTTQHSD